MRRIDPPLDQLHRLRTPLTEGERRVLDFFDNWLDPGWEIYIQPHLNGLRPDFVLLNPAVGIAVFEVKDWNLTALGYHWRPGAAGQSVLWATNRDGKDFQVADDPVAKIDEYRDRLAELYCPSIGFQALRDKSIRALITGGVIMTQCTTAAAAACFNRAREERGMLHEGLDRYYPLAGGDALAEARLDVVFPEARRRASRYMTPKLAADLRTWLVEPSTAAEQRQPLVLDRRQHEFATTRTRTGYRRIRGPAGSGKSVVVAARAGHITAAGQTVLVVSFNITLWHWLRDMARRYQVAGRDVTGLSTWTHFHEWCRRLCDMAGWLDQYIALFQGRDLDQVLDVELPALARRAVEHLRDNYSGEAWSYDAILVDEGQDYRIEWWDLLRACLRDGGEMLLVADRAQDVYERTGAWTEEAMSRAGFRGPWSDLTRSYRLPEELIPLVRRFVERFAPDKLKYAPEQVQLVLDETRLCCLRWVQVADPAELAVRCVEELLRLPLAAARRPVAMADRYLLVPDHQLGLECVQLLADREIESCHVFGRDHAEQKPRKLGFWAGDAALKASTIHSFKGWESRAIVVCIAAADTQRRDLYYVALTRLKQNEDGSYLTVVCADPEMAELGRHWPEFVSARPAGPQGGRPVGGSDWPPDDGNPFGPEVDAVSRSRRSTGRWRR